jgi:chorismate synthase
MLSNKDYSNFEEIPRPGHADYTYVIKYGVKAKSGGGRASARETIGRVLAGAVAEKYLKGTFGTKFVSWVDSIGNISLQDIDKEEYEALLTDLSDYGKEVVDQRGTLLVLSSVSHSRIYVDHSSNIYSPTGELLGTSSCSQSSLLENTYAWASLLSSEEKTELLEVVNFRCPHPPTAVKMIEKVKEVKELNDSVGGVAAGMVVGPPVGIGEPWFDKYEALLGMAMLSLPATKGFEFGSGFEGTKMLGSQHNGNSSDFLLIDLDL